MATRDEDKAEFYRVLRSDDERSRRSLGVLLNPQLGFTPKSRPLSGWILSIQCVLYQSITGCRLNVAFNKDVRRFAQNHVDRQRHHDGH